MQLEKLESNNIWLTTLKKDIKAPVFACVKRNWRLYSLGSYYFLWICRFQTSVNTINTDGKENHKYVSIFWLDKTQLFFLNNEGKKAIFAVEQVYNFHFL